MCHELCVGRMVRRFDADNLRFERAVVLVDVSEEVELGLGRTDKKNLSAALEAAGHLSKVPVLVVGMVPDAQIDLTGMAMDVRAG